MKTLLAIALLLAAQSSTTMRPSLGTTMRSPTTAAPAKPPLTLAGNFTAFSHQQWGGGAVLDVLGVNASAGQLMVLLAGQVHDALQGAGNGELIATVTDPGLNVWTRRHTNASPGGHPNAEIWTAPVTTALVASAVTVTYAANYWEPRLTVLVFSNADLVTPIGATAIAGGTNRAGGALSATVDVGPTQQAGSLVVAALARFDDGGAVALTATSVPYDSNDFWSRLVTSSTLTPAVGATVSVGFVAIPGFASYAGAEVRHAP